MSIEVAQNNLERYGNYPVCHTFSTNDMNASSQADSPNSAGVAQAYSAAFDPNDGIKRHAACDECRKRKLKCSGEPSGCSRCTKQKLICHYSEQKQMGRPRKRQRTDSEIAAAQNSLVSPPRAIQPAPEPEFEPGLELGPESRSISNNHNYAADPVGVTHSYDKDRSQFESICNAPLAQTIRSSVSAQFADSPLPIFDTSNSISPQSQLDMRTPETANPMNTTYPTDVALWPDFSEMDLPLPVEDKFMGVDNLVQDPDVDPQALSNLPSMPPCPCLPNLYLTLSTLSTLSSFPFNQQTIHTIEAAYRTARGVIYCPACPQKFETGSSNLMLGCTLLNVLANTWNRFRSLGVADLLHAFGTPDTQQKVMSTKSGQAWRTFGEQMIRAYVFGDQPVPTPPGALQPYGTPESENGALTTITTKTNTNIPTITLSGLCDAMARRQRQWHHLEELTDEFPDRVTPDLMHGHMVGHTKDEPGKHLCLEIVGMSQSLVRALATPSLPHM